jgi:hypothetical protein
VEHPESPPLADFLGGEQLVPAEGGHRFVGLDAPEPGVFVAQVAEAGDQQPFQGVLALLIRGGRGRRQGLGPLQAGRVVLLWGEGVRPLAAAASARGGPGDPVLVVDAANRFDPYALALDPTDSPLLRFIPMPGGDLLFP